LAHPLGPAGQRTEDDPSLGVHAVLAGHEVGREVAGRPALAQGGGIWPDLEQQRGELSAFVGDDGHGTSYAAVTLPVVEPPVVRTLQTRVAVPESPSAAQRNSVGTWTISFSW